MTEPKKRERVLVEGTVAYEYQAGHDTGIHFAYSDPSSAVKPHPERGVPVQNRFIHPHPGVPVADLIEMVDLFVGEEITFTFGPSFSWQAPEAMTRLLDLLDKYQASREGTKADE